MTGSRAKRSKRGRRIVDGTGNACERAEGRGAVRALPRCWRTRQGGYSRTNVKLRGERPGEAVPKHGGFSQVPQLEVPPQSRQGRSSGGEPSTKLAGTHRAGGAACNKETQQFRMGCPLLTNQSRAAILPWQACRKYPPKSLLSLPSATYLSFIPISSYMSSFSPPFISICPLAR